MRSRFGCQQTNRPEVDAGRTAARKVKNRRRTITRKTTAKQIEQSPFSLATAAGFLQSALRTADREPMGGFLWGLPFSVRQE